MAEWIAKILSACAGLTWLFGTGTPSFLLFGEEPFPSPEEE